MAICVSEEDEIHPVSVIVDDDEFNLLFIDHPISQDLTVSTYIFPFL